jgi:hypothetical protein
MAENVENLILIQSREMRAETAEMRGEIANVRREMQEGFESTNAKVDGLALLLSMPAGHVHGLETRIERLEQTRG